MKNERESGGRWQLLAPSKKPQRVRARSLVCSWVVSQPGVGGTSVGKKLGTTRFFVSGLYFGIGASGDV
ncbi:MAG: hypothetical protein KAV83_12140 [Desulfobacterales bacterium]|nr:hypothetical protein [Desulfobacterales bacterium]